MRFFVRSRIPFAVLLALFFTASAVADVPLVAEKVRELMQDRQYVEAIEAIDAAADAENAPSDYLAYLKGRAFYLQKQYDRAVETFDAFGEKFPKSSWARHARFAKALALARKGDFRGAELIYRAEAEYLLSEDRKQELADIYLEFADDYFDPEEETQNPNHARALEFYRKALDVGLVPKKKIEVDLLVARCLQELGKFDEAVAQYETLIEPSPESTVDIEAQLDIEARFRLGESRLAQDRLKEARRAWQDLLVAHEDFSSERIPEVTFRLSRCWHVPKPKNDEELSLGVAALETFLTRFPEHKLAGQTHLDIAQSYGHRGRYEDAVTALTRFLEDERYKDREQIPDARNLLGHSYQLQKKFDRALAVWREYLALHPAHQSWSSVQHQIVQTEYLMAHEAYRAKKYPAARKLWGEFLAKYPLDERNPTILNLFGDMSYQEEKWPEAIAEWRRLVSKYPKTDPASRAQFMIAATLEQKLVKLEEALDEYRELDWGNHAAKAKQAVSRMTAKSMSIATDRVFRSDETPKIKLTTRNLESVTVRVYTIDMETYFRKMHLARGIENLDVALIDPDRTFEFKVPDYTEYQELENSVEVPLPEDATSGATAVTISSKTLDATTLVVQSDLDVIVKSSRDEVFVFAENMRTGKPWPKARLLISDGSEVFAEGTTGDDGVFQKGFKQLKTTNDIRVFAVADGHAASNVVGLAGVGVAKGLSDKGYLYTDRPAYRAGQLVHLRGCIRRAVDDAYTIDADKQYAIEVFDGRNRLVHEEKVALGKFGTFHAHFRLPVTSPQGQYRVLARDIDDRTFQGTFQVHQYKLEPIHLVIDTPRTVYYRGETIEGTIRAAFYHGAPLVGREIRYQLADERLHTVKTDAKGEVHFKLPTREFAETQVLPLAVTLPERNLATSTNFMLATRGFSIGVSTVRPVFVAGETFEVTVKTDDAEGKPAGRKLTLSVLEKTTVDGKVGERMVEQHELETAESDGSVRQTLTVAEGGRYVVRVEGTDRFDTPISGEHPVEISDDRDTVRLRILADKHTLKAGDTARVRLHWREEPALALVTFQGARVLDYQLITLNKGIHSLEIPVDPKLAPNFELAVAVMTDPRETEPAAKDSKDSVDSKDSDRPIRRFHEASSPFTVERDLHVSITTRRLERDSDAAQPGQDPKTIRPGDEFEVTVTTTDPQGKPVAAEVSLAMVEQSLLDRFAWPVPAIQEFFRGERRQSAVRTTASITFAYRPATHAIDPRLLAERDRLAVAVEESLSRESLGEDEYGFASSVEGELVDPFGDTDDDPFGASPSMGGMGGARFGLDVGAPGRAPAQPVANEPASRRSGSRLLSRNPQGIPQVAGRELGLVEEGLYSRGLGRVDDNSFDDHFYFSDGKVDSDSLVELITDSAGTLDRRYVLDNRGTPAILDNNGVMKNIHLGTVATWDIEQARALATELAESGAVFLPRSGSQETGYWNPAIETGDDGTAVVTFAMPERSTAWKLLAKGLTTETLAGEADGEVVVKKELFGQLKLPMAFTDGDRAQVSVSIHNDAVEKGPIEVTLKTTIGGRTVEETKTLDVSSKGLHELSFPVTLDRPEVKEADQGKDDKDSKESDDSEDQSPTTEVHVQFELTVTAAGQTDVARRVLPLLPYGVPVYATASGSAESDTTAWVEAPKDMPLSAPSMQILVGPTVEQSLLDIVLGPAPACQIHANRIASGLDTATSDLMASLALIKLIGTTREAGSPRAQSLDARVRAAVSLLVSSQNDDGAWSWTGRGSGANRYGTSRVLWALSLARAAGYTVPDDCFSKAVGFSRDQIAKLEHSDYESQAILLQGLAAAGHGDFALANRLYRSRSELSSPALAYLTLAFAKMDRGATASEILDLLAGRNPDELALRRNTTGGSTPCPQSWNASPVEFRAIYALAVQAVSPKSPAAKEQVDWLLAHRTGHRWAPDKATGPAAMALCQWFAQTRHEGERYELAVFVNDIRVGALDIDPAAGTRVIDVPEKLLIEGKQRINFQITGRGQYTYQCILAGFVPTDKLPNTNTHPWRITRRYEPAFLELDGREIPRGFSVLTGGYSSFYNPLTQLPVGHRGMVEIHAYSTSHPPHEYMVIVEPIPSGTTVIENSIRGNFERFEISSGAITFYVGSRSSASIRYELHGYLPGRFRAGPTQVRSAYRPDLLILGVPKPLEVLAVGQTSSDEYRLTPRELYELGKRHFEKGNLAEARDHLTELIEHEKWKLRSEIYQDVVEKLLDVHLALGPAAKVVHYFEIVKEKWPEREISFDKILKVGTAYHEMGEYERSYLVFRATVQSSFMRESRVAGFLESQGEFLRSVDVMGRLLEEYPPEPYVAAATYALGQRVYAKAPEAAEDPKLRKRKINRVDLIRRAWTMLEAFLTGYPEDPAADQVAFASTNALLELDAYPQAAAAAARHAKRFTKSDLLDSFWYMIGYCHFATGRHDDALAMCRKVAETERVDPATGRRTESPNKWQAIYILGQVHHSLDRAAEAIVEYRRVQDRFADAKEAIDYFLRKAIELPEVTTVAPGKPVEVELAFRNIASCDAKVYRIDLMKFSLLKRNLGGITRINLAGIRPQHEMTVKLGDGLDYGDRTHALELPLTEEGAYLVVCRGENLHASGLVLITPLGVEVQEDHASGRVRATVKDQAADRYLNEVHVKVIGSRNREFISGETDLRGVFVADGIQGTSTVIAQLEPSRYAFFRGETELGASPPAEYPATSQPSDEPAPVAIPSPAKPQSGQSLKRQLLENVYDLNTTIQHGQVGELQDVYQNENQGVQAKEAF